MEHEHLRAVVENDELELRGDDLTIDIARMTGKGLRSAFASREQHNTVLMFDQLAQSNDESIEAIGLPDPRVSSATERGQAAANSLGIYLAIANRDEHLAWGAAVLWLAFGFAVALSARPK